MSTEFRVIAVGSVIAVATFILLACASAGAQQTRGPCGPPGEAATEYRAWLVEYFSDPGYQLSRTKLGLSTAPADSIVQVADTTLCAGAAAAVQAEYNASGPLIQVYLFRVQSSFAAFFPPDPTQPSYVFYLTDSLQVLGAAIR